MINGQRDSNESGETTSRDRGPASCPPRRQVAGVPVAHASELRTSTADTLLVAASAGWGLTLRYALLMIVRRASIPVAAFVVFKIGQAVGWM